MFFDMAKTAKKIWKSIEASKKINVLKLLDKIIPDEYFGNRKHRKLFYKVVKLILTSSANECIYVNRLLSGYNLHEIPWLTDILYPTTANSKKEKQYYLSKKYFFEGQLWVLDRIVKPLIFRFYATVKKGKNHEVEFVPRHLAMSFQSKVFNYLCNLKYVSNCEQTMKPRGLLQLRPKQGYKNHENFRPIMKLFSYSITKPEILYIRQIARNVRSLAQKMSETKTNNLYLNWRNYTTTHSGPIFAAKVDLSDAFGNININYLCNILAENSTSEKLMPNNANMIINHIQNQIVCFGRTNNGSLKRYQWHHGLLQGDRFSAALCELYLSYMDSIYLANLYKENALIHRTVDDYFFCSTNEADVEEFLKIMYSIHEINTVKTYSNLKKYGHDAIPYCGRYFTMKSKEISGLYDFKKGFEIRHRFRCWNIEYPIYFKNKTEKTNATFLAKSMKFNSNTFHFNKLELNTVYNTERRVMKNYFEAMIMLAFKFDCTIISIFDRLECFSIITKTIKVTVHKYSHKTIAILKGNQGLYHKGMLTFPLFLKLGFLAFKLVLMKRFQYQKRGIPQILSKWVKSIPSNGIYYKSFYKLPKCFNHISIQRKLPHQEDY